MAALQRNDINTSISIILRVMTTILLATIRHHQAEGVATMTTVTTHTAGVELTAQSAAEEAIAEGGRVRITLIMMMGIVEGEEAIED